MVKEHLSSAAVSLTHQCPGDCTVAAVLKRTHKMLHTKRSAHQLLTKSGKVTTLDTEIMNEIRFTILADDSFKQITRYYNINYKTIDVCNDVKAH